MIVTRNKRRNAARSKTSRKPDAVGQYASDAWSLAKRTAYGLNEIRKLINIETKFLDTVQVSTAIGTTGVVFSISSIAQGLTSQTRVGDSLKIQHIEVKGRINVNPAASNSVVRVLVFRDLDGYGTAPTGADVMELDAAVSAPLSPYKFRNLQRFSILYDELMEVQGIVQGTAGIPFSYSSSHAGHILYLGTASAAASNGKGSLYVLCVSDEATNAATLAFYSRVLFTDD
jgi:hypothetical protein